MQPITDSYTARLTIGPDRRPDGGLTGSLVWMGLVALALVVASYPVASAAALAGCVAVFALGRTLVRHVDTGTVRKVSLPGLGTVEYRFTRS